MLCAPTSTENLRRKPGLQVNRLAGQRPFHMGQALDECAQVVSRLEAPAVLVRDLGVEKVRTGGAFELGKVIQLSLAGPLHPRCKPGFPQTPPGRRIAFQSWLVVTGNSCSDQFDLVLTSATHPVRICVSIVYSFGDAMRDAAINLRALPQQRDLIDQAASLLGKNRSDFMLEAACDKAQSVLLDQVFFSLDDAKFREFTAMLDAPVQPNPGLERLLAVKAPWKVGA